MAKRRLTKTAVEEAIHETKTKPFVERVRATEKMPDGRHEVDVILSDAIDDPRGTPYGAALIGHLEASGWLVHHRYGREYSRLIVAEPVASSDSPKED